MRVLHVLEAVEGGTALHVRHLAGAQARRGDDVMVVVPCERSWGRTDRSLATELEGRVDVRTLDMRRDPAHPANARALRALVAMARPWHPDVIHGHSTTGGVLARLLGRWISRPALVTMNGVRFAEPGLGPAAAAAAALELAMRALTTVVVAVSESEAEVLRRVHGDRRVVVVPNGIPSRPEPRASLPATPTAVCVGRFVHQKHPLLAVEVLAAACRLAPGSRGVLVGYGDLADDVHRRVAELDPKLEVTDAIDGAEAIASATVVLLCSRFEGAPYVVLEAMERGRAVVATDVVGSRDAVDHGTTGYLFPLDDVEAGSAAAAAVLIDRPLAERLGAAGRAAYDARFTLAAMVEAVDAAYRRASA